MRLAHVGEIRRLTWMAAPLTCVAWLGAARPVGNEAGSRDPQVNGIRYDITLTTVSSHTSEDGEASNISTAHVQMSNHKVRMDIASGEFAGFVTDGDVMLFTD